MNRLEMSQSSVWKCRWKSQLNNYMMNTYMDNLRKKIGWNQHLVYGRFSILREDLE